MRYLPVERQQVASKRISCIQIPPDPSNHRTVRRNRDEAISGTCCPKCSPYMHARRVYCPRNNRSWRDSQDHRVWRRSAAQVASVSGKAIYTANTSAISTIATWHPLCTNGWFPSPGGGLRCMRGFPPRQVWSTRRSRPSSSATRPGSTASSCTWVSVADASYPQMEDPLFTANYNLVAFDTRGHGGTIANTEKAEYTASCVADDLAAGLVGG